MKREYRVQCDCGSVQLLIKGDPKVKAFCHCEDCRVLLDVPYHSVTAWEQENVTVYSGDQHAVEYKYPTLEMTRVFCKQCGETLYNTNAMGWRLVSQLLIRKCNLGELPEELHSNAHYYYDQRIVSISDSLLKS